jgi:hypothetical protein
VVTFKKVASAEGVMWTLVAAAANAFLSKHSGAPTAEAWRVVDASEALDAVAEHALTARWSRLWPPLQLLAAVEPLAHVAAELMSMALPLMLPTVKARVDAVIDALSTGSVRVAVVLIERICELDSLRPRDSAAEAKRVLKDDRVDQELQERYIGALRRVVTGDAPQPASVRRAALRALRIYLTCASTNLETCTRHAISWLDASVASVERAVAVEAALADGGRSDVDDDDDDVDGDDSDSDERKGPPAVIGAVLIPLLGLLCSSLKSSLELGSDGAGAWPLVQQSAMQLAAPLKRFIAVMCAAAARHSWHRRWSVAYVDVAHAVSQVAAILRSASGPPVLRHLVEWIDSGLLTLGAPADAQAAGATNDVRFLEDLLAARADTDGGALATVMAELYTERQPLGKRGGAAVARAERAVAAALLHHTGRINTGRSFATIALHRALKSSGGRAPSDSKTKLPPALRSLWERAYQVRSWLINKLHALETDDNKDGAELLAQQVAVCDAVVERMRFLFGTVPLTSPAASDVAVADSAQTLFSSVAVRSGGGTAAAAAAAVGASPQSLFAGRKGLSLERVERSRGSGDGRALLRGSFGVQNSVLEGDARVRALLETYSVWRTWRQRGGARAGMALSGSGSGGSDAFAVAAATVASEAGGTSEAAEVQKAEPLVLRFAMAENVVVKELATLVLAQNSVADARSTSLALVLSTLPTGGSAVSLGSKLLPDILAAVMNSLLDVRKPHALMAHYAQQLQVCGAAQRALLRDSFMALYGALVDVARQCAASTATRRCPTSLRSSARASRCSTCFCSGARAMTTMRCSARASLRCCGCWRRAVAHVCSSRRTTPPSRRPTPSLARCKSSCAATVTSWSAACAAWAGTATSAASRTMAVCHV